MKKFLLISFIGSILSGCVSDIKYNYVPEVVQKSYPELNVVTTTYIGDDMVRQGNTKIMDAISFPVVTQVNRFWHSYIIDAGDYPKLGEDKNHLFFAAKSINGNAIVKSLSVPAPPIGIRVSKDSSKNEVCISFPAGTDFCESNKQFTYKKVSVTSQDGFQQTLIYNGKVGNKINIGYREFNNDMARPAFSNNAEYDLSRSKIIRYKGAVIEIQQATNQYIKYKVISNFNTPNR
jgi:hypothetical protein